MRKPTVFCLLVGLGAMISACGEEDALLSASQIQARLDAVEACFPALWASLEPVLRVAQSMGRNDTVPLPPGFDYELSPGGTVSGTIDLSGTVIGFDVVFYSPGGVQQDLGLTDPGDFNVLIDDAATALADTYGGQQPFIVLSWTIDTSATYEGGGAFTGILGGTTNQNELQELRTTGSTPAGGPPPVAAENVRTMGGGCELFVTTASLSTDAVAGQRYPWGTVDIRLESMPLTGDPVAVDATLTMNNTVLAALDIDRVPGYFEINLDTADVNYVGE